MKRAINATKIIHSSKTCNVETRHALSARTQRQGMPCLYPPTHKKRQPLLAASHSGLNKPLNCFI